MVAGSNFSISSFPRSEFDGSNESSAKLELHKSRRDNVWQMIDLSDRAKSVPSLDAVDSKLKSKLNYKLQKETWNILKELLLIAGATNYSMWDIFEVLSKIRMAFFRSLLESLGRRERASEIGFSSRKLFSFKPTVSNLIGNVIKKLKSMPNNKGYMLIATVSGNELAAAVDLVQNEVIIILLNRHYLQSSTKNYYNDLKAHRILIYT